MPPVGKVHSISGRPDYRTIILASMPGTKEEIRIRSGATQTTSLKWINLLHTEGSIHIERWVRHPRTGKHMPVFALGAGKDASCRLKRKPRSEYDRRYREKAEKTGMWDVRKAKNRIVYWERKAARTPQTWASALMGM